MNHLYLRNHLQLLYVDLDNYSSLNILFFFSVAGGKAEPADVTSSAALPDLLFAVVLAVLLAVSVVVVVVVFAFTPDRKLDFVSMMNAWFVEIHAVPV
jgi:hypothetical protein